MFVCFKCSLGICMFILQLLNFKADSLPSSSIVWTRTIKRMTYMKNYSPLILQFQPQIHYMGGKCHISFGFESINIKNSFHHNFDDKRLQLFLQPELPVSLQLLCVHACVCGFSKEQLKQCVFISSHE